MVLARDVHNYYTLLSTETYREIVCQSWQYEGIFQAKITYVEGAVISDSKCRVTAKIRTAVVSPSISKSSQTEIEEAVTSATAGAVGGDKTVTAAVHCLTGRYGTLDTSTSRVTVAKEIDLHNIASLCQGTHLQNKKLHHNFNTRVTYLTETDI